MPSAEHQVEVADDAPSMLRRPRRWTAGELADRLHLLRLNQLLLREAPFGDVALGSGDFDDRAGLIGDSLTVRAYDLQLSIGPA